MSQGNGDGFLGAVILLFGFFVTVIYVLIVLPLTPQKILEKREQEHRNRVVKGKGLASW